MALFLPISILKSCGSPISSWLYPLFSLRSLSLSPGLLLLCTQPGRPMPPAQPVKVQRGSAASGSEQLEHGAGWMDRDRDCGTATNTGGAPVGLHGDNISGAARWPTGRGYSNEQRSPFVPTTSSAPDPWVPLTSCNATHNG